MDLRAAQQWKEYYKDKQNWTNAKQETFLDGMAPMNEFARFMDKTAERIVRDTPFKSWHPINLIPGSNLIPLGNVDNFDCLMEVNSVTRNFVIRFNPTLHTGISYQHSTNPGTDPVNLINKGFNMAKLGIKSLIAERRQYMMHYEKLEAVVPDECVHRMKCDDI